MKHLSTGLNSPSKSILVMRLLSFWAFSLSSNFAVAIPINMNRMRGRQHILVWGIIAVSFCRQGGRISTCLGKIQPSVFESLFSLDSTLFKLVSLEFYVYNWQKNFSFFIYQSWHNRKNVCHHPWFLEFPTFHAPMKLLAGWEPIIGKFSETLSVTSPSVTWKFNSLSNELPL